MNLLQRFIDYIKKENLFNSKDKLLLAVSGGVDSVVLCELCHQAGNDFAIAHCNFKLRGEESERDEQFVRDLAKKYGVEFFIKDFDTEKYAEENKTSIQVAARELRYNWFYELVNSQLSVVNVELSNLKTHTHHSPLPTHIVTAHHANDNIETLLINFFKGTGISGLRGIQPKQNKIIRPLLFAKKEELLEFAKEKQLTFVEDSSNSLDKYTRNYFRNQLIPTVEKLFPQADENLINNIDRFRDIEILYRQSINVHKKNLIEVRGNETYIPILKLLKAEPLPTIIYEVIQPFGFTAHQIEEVIKLLNSETGKYIQSSSHRVINNRKWLIISPNNTLAAENILIEKEDQLIEYQNGKLKIEKVTTDNFTLSSDNYIASLDADTVRFPLILRKWKQGDYFYPLGMKKKKKLSKFFIDNKLSLLQKENIWVIEMDKKIVWVVGQRIDERFKIKPSTKNIIKISQY